MKFLKCQNISGYFWRAFLPVAFLTTVLSVTVYVIDTKIKLHSLKAVESLALISVQKVIEQEVAHALSDLAVLSENQYFRIFGKENTQDIAKIEHDFLTFIKNKKNYTQIRFIDTTGKEVIRVNNNDGHPMVVSKYLLQNKSTRYYFLEAMKLTRNEFYLSPLDLNIEDGKIEEPRKPMLRFLTPVFNDQGEKVGIVVINYLAADLLNQIKQSNKAGSGKILLLNQDSFYLIGMNADDEWAFMYPDKQTINFAQQFPAAWKAMSTLLDGQLYQDTELLSFTHIHPLIKESPSIFHFQKEINNSQRAVNQDYQWTLISYITASSLQSKDNFYHLGANLLFLGIFAVGSWGIAAARCQRDQRKNELTEEREKFRLVADYTYNWEYWLAPDGSYNYMSPSCERISGYKIEDYYNTPDLFLSIVHPDDLKPVKNHWQIKHESHGLCKMEFRIKTHSGEEKWLLHTCQPVFSKNNEFLGRRGSNSDISDRKKIELELENSATHDALTNLPNRKFVYQRLEQVASQAARGKRKFAILFIDLDKFKAINDTFGHQAGDTILKVTASRMEHNLRKEDTIARIGGDEFLAVIPDISSRSDAKNISKKLMDAASEPISITVDNRTVWETISASIGISIYPDDSQIIDELIKMADKSMYAVKSVK